MSRLKNRNHNLEQREWGKKTNLRGTKGNLRNAPVLQAHSDFAIPFVLQSRHNFRVCTVVKLALSK